ncbi:MAG: hypothetical protein QM541_01035 [Flavobacterium sp.]|nr:hypothetical protein [Flavobacterium sp.]
MRDYIELFSKDFEILETIDKYNNLGENYLTDNLKKELFNEFTEKELMTNQVAFVLKNNKKH